jgi:hypothetical protein
MIDVDARHHNLSFLLGLAPMMLGCSVGVADDGNQFTSANPGTTPGDAGPATQGSSDGSGASVEDDTNGDADPDASASASVSVSVGNDDSTSDASASASVSVSVSVSVGDDGTSYGYTSADTGYIGGRACEAYAYVLAACYYGGDPAQAAMFLANCEEGIAYFEMYYGPACAAAFEESIVCISQLPCEQLPNYGMPGVCDMEAAAFSAACN